MEEPIEAIFKIHGARLEAGDWRLERSPSSGEYLVFYVKGGRSEEVERLPTFALAFERFVSLALR